jgi:hypothetical protein
MSQAVEIAERHLLLSVLILMARMKRVGQMEVDTFISTGKVAALL